MLVQTPFSHGGVLARSRWAEILVQERQGGCIVPGSVAGGRELLPVSDRASF
jgi:hypothetical protein